MSETIERTMMPGLARLAPGTALVLSLRMQALRRMKVSVALDNSRFIAEVCHLKPDDLTPEQRARVNRLAWRFRTHMPSAARPESDPDR